MSCRLSESLGSAQKLAYLFEEGMCGQLSLGKSYAYRVLQAGEIPTYTVGRRRYVTHEALMAFRDKLMHQQSTISRGGGQ